MNTLPNILQGVVSDTVFLYKYVENSMYYRRTGEARWPGGRASDSGARGRGFDPHSGRRVESLRKIHLPPKKVLVIPRKRGLHPDMTEKLLTET